MNLGLDLGKRWNVTRGGFRLLRSRKFGVWKVLQSSRTLMGAWKLSHGFLVECHPPSSIMVRFIFHGPTGNNRVCKGEICLGFVLVG